MPSSRELRDTAVPSTPCLTQICQGKKCRYFSAVILASLSATLQSQFSLSVVPFFHYLLNAIFREKPNKQINKVLLKGCDEGPVRPHAGDADMQARPDLRELGDCRATSALSPRSPRLLGAKCDVDTRLLDGDRNSFSISQAS